MVRICRGACAHHLGIGGVLRCDAWASSLHTYLRVQCGAPLQCMLTFLQQKHARTLPHDKPVALGIKRP